MLHVHSLLLYKFAVPTDDILLSDLTRPVTLDRVSRLWRAKVRRWKDTTGFRQENWRVTKADMNSCREMQWVTSREDNWSHQPHSALSFTCMALHSWLHAALAFIEATIVGGSCPGVELFDRARLLSITLLKSWRDEDVRRKRIIAVISTWRTHAEKHASSKTHHRPMRAQS